jgi:hypothetical protein
LGTEPDSFAATPLPTALPLPAAAPNPEATAAKPVFPVDTSLIPGRMIEPIDLPTALKLAGVRDLDIAIARQQLVQAVADLEKARALWLPSVFLGPTWYRADGQVQTITRQIQNVNRNSLFIGGMAATANGFAAPSPGTGYPPVNGMSSVLRFSDAIFEPLAARRVVNADRAGIQTSINNAMLEVAEAYFDLQQASGLLAIAREAAANALALSGRSRVPTLVPARGWRPTTAAPSPSSNTGARTPSLRPVNCWSPRPTSSGFSC